jgi:hypothetical protein
MSKKMNVSRVLSLAVGGAVALVGAQVAHAFTPDDLVLVTVTGNSTPGSSDAAALQEFTPAGSSVGSAINLQTPSGAALTLPDTGDHDGQLLLSSNGQVLTMGAYLTPVGSPAGNTLAASVAPRTIIVVGLNGSLNTSTQLTGASDYPGTANTPLSLRSVVSTDGTQFWTDGNGLKPFGPSTADVGGLRYTTLGATSTTSLNQSGGIDVRTPAIFNGQLYADTGSSNSPAGAHTLYSVGTGLPTSGAQTFTALANTSGGAPITGNQAPNFDTLADGSVVLYESDSTTNTLDKWLFASGTNTWTSEGSTSLGGIEDVTSLVNGNSVNIYATTATGVFALTDTGDGALTATFGSPIISAAPGEQFRGIAVVPEPASVGILGAAAFGLLLRRRRA